jgi:hypothetical protein
MQNNTKIEKVTRIINLTAHPVVLLGKENRIIKTFESEGSIRLSQHLVDVKLLEIERAKIRVTKTVFGKAEGVPDQEDGVYYIVSAITKIRVPRQGRLFNPIRITEGAK